MPVRKVHGYIEIIHNIYIKKYISSHELLFEDKIDSIISTSFSYVIFRRVFKSYEKFINCNQSLYIDASYQLINDY